jgi:hypothetical protein
MGRELTAPTLRLLAAGARASWLPEGYVAAVADEDGLAILVGHCAAEAIKRVPITLDDGWFRHAWLFCCAWAWAESRRADERRPRGEAR